MNDQHVGGDQGDQGDLVAPRKLTMNSTYNAPKLRSAAFPFTIDPGDLVDPGARTGWVWGAHIGTDRSGVPWLTVLGSAYVAPILAATAREAIPHPALAGMPEPAVLARVVELTHPGVTGPRGMAYRVLEHAAAFGKTPAEMTDQDRERTKRWRTMPGARSYPIDQDGADRGQS